MRLNQLGSIWQCKLKIIAQSYRFRRSSSNVRHSKIEWLALFKVYFINSICRLKVGNSCYYSVQTLLSSRLSKNLKIKIYKTIILPVVLYGCETLGGMNKTWVYTSCSFLFIPPIGIKSISTAHVPWSYNKYEIPHCEAFCTSFLICQLFNLEFCSQTSLACVDYLPKRPSFTVIQNNR